MASHGLGVARAQPATALVQLAAARARPTTVVLQLRHGRPRPGHSRGSAAAWQGRLGSAEALAWEARGRPRLPGPWRRRPWLGRGVA
jgi:hypothetical protein